MRNAVKSVRGLREGTEALPYGLDLSLCGVGGVDFGWCNTVGAGALDRPLTPIRLRILSKPTRKSRGNRPGFWFIPPLTIPLADGG